MRVPSRLPYCMYRVHDRYTYVDSYVGSVQDKTGLSGTGPGQSGYLEGFFSRNLKTN